MKHVLLTGATGLVGRYLIRDLLRAGVPLAVVIRPNRSKPAATRLQELLDFWQTEGVPLAAPVCLEGDITRPGLGLSGSDRGWVEQHCQAILHNAADLTFVGPDRAREPWLSNLNGTQNVLDLCRAAGVRQLHHVSTAFVSGNRSGLVLERDFDLDQGFRNDYEQSKFEAEKAVRDASFLESTTIYRPAIIVGDAQTGYTSTYHGFYFYVRFAWILVNALSPQEDGRYYYRVRLNGTGQEVRNLVPVDWVSAVTSHIVTHPELHNQTYHLTPARPNTAAEIEQALASYFNYHGPEFADPSVEPVHESSELDWLLGQYAGKYQPYWGQEPLFDDASTRAAAPHLTCPTLDQACLHRLIDFAVKNNWGKLRREATAAGQS